MVLKTSFVVIIFTIGTVFAADAGNETAECDPGWTQHLDNCYLTVPVKQTWKMAQDICETPTFGGQLAEASTPEVQTFIDGYLSKAFEKIFGNELFWLGGTDQYIEGDWVWSSSNASFTNETWWEHATPNNNPSANCLIVGKVTLNKFKDESCDSQHLFICEKSITQATTTTAPTSTHTDHGGGNQNWGGLQTTQPPDTDTNHELPVFVG